MLGVAALACALPVLLALTAPPSSTLLNQLAACSGWGFAACAWAVWGLGRSPVSKLELREPGGQGVSPLWLALGVVVACVVLAGFQGRPLSLTLLALGMLVAVGLVMLLGQAVVRDGSAEAVFAAFCQALVLAAVLNTGVALLQVWAPQAMDGVWLAQTSAAIAGRAAGNVRQPNHLSSLLLLGLVAIVWLHGRDARACSRAGDALCWGLMAWLCLGVVLTGSRTGALGVVGLALWGALDRRLLAPARWGLLAVLGLYGVLAWGWSAGLQGGRLGGAADMSASRFGIWSNAWTLVQDNTWWGVGWGGFNWAWTLTPFPGRPVAFFDHAHNLLLHLMVELGVPLAVLLCGLLGWALWRAMARGWRLAGPRGGMATAAAMMVAVMALHSQFEYPLWYAYFLLPTGFVWALSLSLSEPGTAPMALSSSPQRWLPVGHWRVMLLGALVTLGSLATLLDYLRVVVIFAPRASSGALAERIAAGQRSVLFSHQADYAQATTHPRAQEVLPSIRQAAHSLIDTRLLSVWAQAYADQGDFDRARYLAQRLREFSPHHALFEPCEADVKRADATPFQCLEPNRLWTPDDFLGND